MNIGRACSLLALCLAAAGPISAQQDSSRVLLGPMFGMGWGRESGRVPVYGFFSDCGEFSSGTAQAMSAGAVLSLPSVFSRYFGLSFTASVSRSTGTLTGAPSDPVIIVDGIRIVRLEREYRLRHEFYGVGLDMLGTFSPIRDLELGAGISAGYIPSISFEQTDNIVGPEDYSFPGGQTSVVMLDGPRLTAAGFRFGPKVHLALRLPVGKSIWLQPGVTVEADLLSLVDELQWQRVSINGGLALLFDLLPAPAPPAVPADPAPRAPLLTASIELFGVDDNGHPQPAAMITVDEKLYRQHTPLLPLLFFDLNESSLPQRYEPSTVSEADGFSLEKLGALNILEMQHHMLDVVGWRLRNDTSATITLAGSVSREEPAALARARAENVRSYLEKIWGIDRSRITVDEETGHLQRSNEATEDGRTDNRRVEISSRTAGIMTPVVTEQVLRDFNPPVIRILPTYDAEAGLKNWIITISQEKNIITRYSYLDSQTRQEPELTWSIVNDRIDSGLAPLKAELTVEDSTGATVTSTTQIPLVLMKKLTVIDGRVERQGDHEQIAHTLVAFDYNSVEPGTENRARITALAADVSEGATITIVGYADRVGDERYNVGLSLNRAERVAEVLRTKLRELGIREVAIKTRGTGMEGERFPNDLPEGRALSRGALVIIEQKAPDTMDRGR